MENAPSLLLSLWDIRMAYCLKQWMAVDGSGWQGAPEAGRAYFFGNACWEISRYFRPAIYVRITIMNHQL